MILNLEINDNSELFSVDDLLNCFEYCNGTNRWTRNKDYKYFLNKNLCGVYFLYNQNKEIIYIGKTINCLRERLKQHLYSEIRLELGYQGMQIANKKRDESYYFSYIEVNKEIIDCAEVLLINKYQPKYNFQYTNKMLITY
jgi:excinuclease UvrABC nuclease subunit